MRARLWNVFIITIGCTIAGLAFHGWSYITLRFVCDAGLGMLLYFMANEYDLWARAKKEST